MKNPWAEPFACQICLDTRFVDRGDGSPVKCPGCGCTCPKPEEGQRRIGTCPGCVKFSDLKAAVLRARPRVGLTESDLTPEECEKMAVWRVQHPRTSNLTLLGWIEGARYNPAADAAFVAQVDRILAGAETGLATTTVPAVPLKTMQMDFLLEEDL